MSGEGAESYPRVSPGDIDSADATLSDGSPDSLRRSQAFGNNCCDDAGQHEQSQNEWPTIESLDKGAERELHRGVG